MTAVEAGELWGLGTSTVKRACQTGRFLPWEARKSGGTWLVTTAGMERVYGKRGRDKMFIIKENIDANKVEVLEHTQEYTAEKCFFSFADCIHEVTLEKLKEEYEEEESDISMEEYYLTTAKDLASKRLFEVWDGGSESRVFGYNEEPDWNEMLERRYSTINTSKGYKSKYFIDTAD